MQQNFKAIGGPFEKQFLINEHNYGSSVETEFSKKIDREVNRLEDMGEHDEAEEAAAHGKSLGAEKQKEKPLEALALKTAIEHVESFFGERGVKIKFDPSNVVFLPADSEYISEDTVKGEFFRGLGLIIINRDAHEEDFLDLLSTIIHELLHAGSFMSQYIDNNQVQNRRLGLRSEKPVGKRNIVLGNDLNEAVTSLIERVIIVSLRRKALSLIPGVDNEEDYLLFLDQCSEEKTDFRFVIGIDQDGNLVPHEYLDTYRRLEQKLIEFVETAFPERSISEQIDIIKEIEEKLIEAYVTGKLLPLARIFYSKEQRFMFKKLFLDRFTL